MFETFVKLDLFTEALLLEGNELRNLLYTQNVNISFEISAIEFLQQQQKTFGRI